MMNGILFANIAAAAAVIIILLLRRLFRDKFSSGVFVLLWALVIIRLLFPFELSSSLSVYKIPEQTPYVQETQTVQTEEELEQEIYITEGTKTERAGTPASTPDNKNAEISLGNLLLAVWISGAAFCGIYFSAKHLCFVKKVIEKSARFYYLPEGFDGGRTRFFECEKLCSPFSFGLLRPAVVIPEKLPEEQLSLVLLHEQTHIKNRDTALKIAALAALSLNWFNPFVWIMVKYLVRDIERFCDEKVLAAIGNEKAALYANAILDFAERESLSLSFFSASSLRERVVSIMKNKTRKKNLPAALCILTAVLIIMTACGTVPRESEKEPEVPQNLNAVIQNVAETESSGEILDLNGEKIGEEITESQKAEEEYEYTVPGDFNGYRVDFTWPCEESNITIGLWGYKGHIGIDIGENEGSEIYAAAEGIVTKVKRVGGGYGWHMVIDHGNSVSTLYAHCREMYVHEGQKVEKGELIGLTGSTGNSASPHLHFELRYGDLYLDPMKHIFTPEMEKSLSSYFEESMPAFTIIKPCEGEVSSSFGGEQNHLGIDFRGEAGSDIFAVADGTVVRVREEGKGDHDLHYGTNVVIDHGNGYQTLYAHCEELFVELGQKVEAGEVIATVGLSGNSTGPHLHFELRIKGEYKDPMDYIR